MELAPLTTQAKDSQSTFSANVYVADYQKMFEYARGVSLALTVRHAVSYVLALGLIFQIFGLTQQSWGQSSSEFEQFAQRVKDVVEGAGVTGSMQEFPDVDSTQYWWINGKCDNPDAACTTEQTRIFIDSTETSALSMFESLVSDRYGYQEFDVGASEKGLVQNDSKAFTDPFQGIGQATAVFVCSTVTGEAFKLSQTAEESAPADATDEQRMQLWTQKKAEADGMASENQAAVESVAKNIVQALIKAGLCNATAQEEKCPVSNNPVETTTSSGSSKYLGQFVSIATNVDDNSAKTPTSTNEAKTFDIAPWKFTYQIVDKQGLVLKDVTAAGQTHFKSVSVPHFEIEYSGGKKKILRFDQNCDISSQISGPFEDEQLKGGNVITWHFAKVFNQTDLKGTLQIDYEILVRSDPARCEFVGQMTGSNCFRFLPKLTFTWGDPTAELAATPERLDSFTAYYKLDYGSVGIALDKNEDNILGNTWKNTGRLEILTTETSFNAVSQGNAGSFDNIHTANPGQTVFVPGCRFTDPVLGYFGTFPPFDCNHMHWRWAGTGVIDKDSRFLNWGVTPNVDVMVDPSTDLLFNDNARGEPYLVPGQTINVAIVRENPNEVDPDNPFSPDILNGETIAKTKPCSLPRSPSSCVLESASPVRLWYVATTYGKSTDTFFQHGTYVVDPKGDYKIRPALEGLRSDLESIRNNITATETTMTMTTKTSAVIVPTTLSSSSPLNYVVDDDDTRRKINEVLEHLDRALVDENWLSDGTLVLEKGADNVFAELSVTADLMQKIKMESEDQNARLSQSMDAATSIILSAAHYLLLSTMDQGIEKIQENLANFSDDDKSRIDNLFAENEALKSSRDYYISAVSESELSNSAQIIDNFRDSWKNGVQGLREVSAELPPTSITLQATSTSGKFKIEVAWISNEIGKENTFAIKIMDTNGQELTGESYDVMLFKGDQPLDETHRTGQTDTEQKYTFAEPGSYSLRIENINGAGENDGITIPIQVTPEFGTIAVALILAMGALILMARRGLRLQS